MLKRLNLVWLVAILFCFNGEPPASAGQLKDAEVLIMQNEYTRAARECKKVLSARTRTKIKARAYYLLGVCELKQGRFSQARKNFQAILRRFPRSPYCDDARLGIAHSYYLAQDFNQAGIRYSRFLQDFPRSQLAGIARNQLNICQKTEPVNNSYFAVQVGCFGNTRNAQRLRDELVDRGFQAYLLELPDEDFCRVRVGRFDTRLEAELLEQNLRARGYPTRVCP
jgi:tetratricopeptide (TPR) repeat protein